MNYSWNQHLHYGSGVNSSLEKQTIFWVPFRFSGLYLDYRRVPHELQKSNVSQWYPNHSFGIKYHSTIKQVLAYTLISKHNSSNIQTSTNLSIIIISDSMHIQIEVIYISCWNKYIKYLHLSIKFFKHLKPWLICLFFRSPKSTTPSSTRRRVQVVVPKLLVPALQLLAAKAPSDAGGVNR